MTATTQALGWAAGPMSAFDLETTGVDPTSARIVTACFATVNTDPPIDPQRWIADPGIDIPAEATAVHGITTEHAREHGAPSGMVAAALLVNLVAVWEMNLPVVIYNAPYDLTVLDHELRRHDMDGIGEIGPVIDPLVLDRHLDPYRRGKRTLDAACQHYGVRLDGAHDSTQDALAAARVAWRIAQWHPKVAALDLAALQQLQADAHCAWAEHFEDYLRSRGKAETIDRSWPVRRADLPATL